MPSQTVGEFGPPAEERTWIVVERKITIKHRTKICGAPRRRWSWRSSVGTRSWRVSDYRSDAQSASPSDAVAGGIRSSVTCAAARQLTYLGRMPPAIWQYQTFSF